MTIINFENRAILSVNDWREEKRLRHEYEILEQQKAQLARDFSTLAQGGVVEEEIKTQRGRRRIKVTPTRLAKLLTSYNSQQHSVLHQMQTVPQIEEDETVRRIFVPEKVARTHEWLLRRGAKQ